MSEEQKEILQMLAEGKISVEEAERLLGALDEGARKREEAESGGAKRQQPVQDALNSVRETLAGVGPMVARMVGEIGTEIQRDRNFPGETDAEELPEMQIEDNRFPVPAGAKLFIRNDKEGGPSGGDLTIESVEGEFCLIEAGEAKNLRVLRSSSGPVVRWAGGPLTVKAPVTAADVYAYTLGGVLKAGRLHCPAQLKSMGGDVMLHGPSHRFSAKSIGGNVQLRLGANSCESSEIRTMGGNIRVEVTEGMPCTDTSAVTVGGSILVEDELGEVKKGVNLGRQKIRLFLGEGQPGSFLKLNTYGGNIEIRRARDES